MTRGKNAHGNVAIPTVPKALLGTRRYPICVFRGERNESTAWLAVFQGLPGYLGIEQSESEAIRELWDMLGDDTIYDVSRLRGIEPTKANIQQFLDRGAKLHGVTDEIRALGNVKDSVIAAVGKAHGVSRNAIKPVLARHDRWNSLGGINSAISNLGYAHMRVALEASRDFQAYLENNPERARLLLARQKFPR